MTNEYDIGAAFKAVEDELMASMIRNTKRHRAEEEKYGFNWEQWQVLQLEALERYKTENENKYGNRFKKINQQIEALIAQARDEGGMKEEIRILRAIKNGFPVKATGKTVRRLEIGADFFKLNERKLNALIEATVNDMKKAETAILRMANDQYRKLIFNAQVYANTGAGTYEKAIDMATRNMLAAGLNCVQYANGARHTLSDYADMAIRTASKRAYLQGEGEKRQEWGISTVIINKRGNPCPKCLPWVGKILIDDVWSGGKAGDGKYPLMSKAIEAGLYHPRCRDSHTTYFPGISTADATWTEKELEAVEKENRDEAKRQYAVRQQEKYTRLTEYSLDSENRKNYSRKVLEWKNVKFETRIKTSEEYLNKKREKDFFGIPQDVTDTWIGSDRKNGSVSDMLRYVVDENIYKVDGKSVLLDYSKHEKEIADIIARESGKKVKLVPRVTFPQGIQTPDYIIDDLRFDLKTPLGNGKNTLYGMIKSKKKQANNFVICADKTALSLEEIESQIRSIYSSRNTAFVDRIVLVKDKKIVRVYKRNK